MENDAKEVLNYGLFYPRDGTFLDEQRTISSYVFNDNVRSNPNRIFR